MKLINQVKDSSLFVKYKILTILISLSIATGLGVGAQYLYFNSSYKTYFSEDNPERVEYEKIEDEFTNNDNILFVLTAKKGTIYDQTFLQAVDWLTKKSWHLPKATRVDSLTNFQHVTADENDLLVDDLIYPNEKLSEADLAKIKRIALSEPLLANRIVKENSNSTAVNVTLSTDEDDPHESIVIADAALLLKKEFSLLYPDIELRLTGSTMLNYAFENSAQEDGKKIVPLMYLVIFVITYLTLKSVLSTFITLIVVCLSTVATVGLAGFMGFYFTSVSAIVPTIVLTLAVADSVHILKTMKEFMVDGMGRKQAIIESMKLNQTPVFLTSITTIIGFLGLNFSAVPSYHDLGNMTAIGVAFAYLFSVTTLPSLVTVLPIKVKLKAKTGATKTDKFSHFLGAYANIIILATGLVLIVSLWAIPKMKSYDEPLKYFSKRIEFRSDTDFVIEHLTGVESIEIGLPSSSGSVADPGYLHDLEQLKTFIETHPEVVHVFSLSDIMKKLNKSMNADNPDFYKLPTQKDLAAQYLLLYELSLPKGLDLGNMLNLNKSSSRVVVTLSDTNSQKLIELSQDIRKWVKDNSNYIDKPLVGSSFVMFAHISKTNINSMVKGTTVTFLLITLSLVVALRSFRYGLLSIVTNVMPSLVAFGIWAITVAKVDIAVAVAATSTIGIIVDFSVHFLAKYSKFSRKEGAKNALNRTFQMVSPPILSTAIILAGGFLMLVLSPFRLNWVLGALSVMMILLATTFVFLTLPALLIKLNNKQIKRSI